MFVDDDYKNWIKCKDDEKRLVKKYHSKPEIQLTTILDQPQVFNSIKNNINSKIKLVQRIKNSKKVKKITETKPVKKRWSFFWNVKEQLIEITAVVKIFL